MKKAVRRSSNSAPGPDGVPYLAWRMLGNESIDILFNAAVELMSDDGDSLLAEHLPNFNESLLLLLPKSSDEALADGTAVFTPEQTRPLSITNTANRLIAAAVRIAIEDVISTLVTSEQRGFLLNRSLLMNLLDVDAEMILVAARNPQPIALFFDFAAAFPSVEQQLLHSYFDALGWPGWLRNVIKCLYLNNACKISLGGQWHDGFLLTRGIRQGCPLSPLLFAVVSELLLRRIRRAIPASVRRAYADDLAVILHNGFTDIGVLSHLFFDYGMISGLFLNIGKTVLVPLFTHIRSELQQVLTRTAPSWVGIAIQDAAKYLGFLLGLGKGERSWGKPVEKYLKRAALWGQAGLGMTLTIRAYSTYVMSVLSYIAQLEHPPKEWDKYEAKAVRKLFVGPMHWVSPEVMKNLDCVSFPMSLPDFRVVAISAKSRVFRQEAQAQGGLQVVRRARELRSEVNACQNLDQWQFLQGWYLKSFFFQLEGAERQVRRRIATLRAQDALPAQYVRWHRAADAREEDRRTGSWQKVAISLLRQSSIGPMTTHLGRRMQRLSFLLFSRARVARAISAMQKVNSLVTPRVGAALLHTVCNGWCTSGRYQQRGHCKFCGRGQDSLNHIARCPSVWKIMEEEAGILRPPPGRELEFLCCMCSEEVVREYMNPAPDSIDAAIRSRAHALYALYRTFNWTRHHPEGVGDCAGVFRTFFREGRLATALLE